MSDRRAFCVGFGLLTLLGRPDAAIAQLVTDSAMEWPDRLSPFAGADLARARGVYEDGVRGLFESDILGRLPPSLRARIGEARLEMPEAAPISPGSPLQVYATTDRTIVLPIRTVLWIDQYAGLTAYFRRCSQSLALCQIYAGMLGQRHGETRPPGPLAAYGLTDDIYADQRVLDENQKLLSSTVCFLLAHELGHIALRHRGGLDPIDLQRQEREADAFALDIMAYLGVFPLGLAVFFGAAAMMENGQTSHPLSGSRVVAIADNVEARPRAFLDPDQPDANSRAARIVEVAQQVRAAAPIIDDPDERTKILQIAGGLTVFQLPQLRASLCSG